MALKYLLNTVTIISAWLIVRQVSGSFQVQSRYIAADGTVLLRETASSELVNLTGLQKPLECLAACQLRGCLLASLIPSSRVCQLVLVNDASRGLGPAGTHVSRLLGSEPGARVWKVENFDALLKMRQLNEITFKNTSTGKNGSIQFLTVPLTGCYRIEASGARGGTNSFSGMAGGSGALVSGAFNLTAGSQLAIVVGQSGGPPNSMYAGGGGGGGSFVYRTADNFLLVAAGGGGAGTYGSVGHPGVAGINGTDTHPYGDSISYGGINGQPGFNNPGAMPGSHNHGGCGSGWLGRPVNPRRWSVDGDRGGGRAEGWIGGLAGNTGTGEGGFGGGGGGGGRQDSNWGAAGAGSGYSGGGTGYSTAPPGGGGGSLCSGSRCNATTGGNSGQEGLVVIQLLEPFVSAC